MVLPFLYSTSCLVPDAQVSKSVYSPLRDDIACVITRGALFRSLAYIAWVQATPEDAAVYAYVPGALTTERAYRTASVEVAARAAWASGATSVNRMQRVAGISHSAASSWVRSLKMEHDTLSNQQQPIVEGVAQ